MNQIHRVMVQEYLESENVRSISPLYFKGYNSSVEKSLEINQDLIKNMIKRVLDLTVHYPSYDAVTNEYDCSSGRNRSSLDIWRHIIYYYPQITIFEVMSALYDIYYEAEGYYGLYCPDINRRVFKIGARDSDYMRNMYLYSRRAKDEYGLHWDDWKDI